jgi:hypothetical protein
MARVGQKLDREMCPTADLSSGQDGGAQSAATQ